MMSVYGCPTKKALKLKVGTNVNTNTLFHETSIFGPEYKGAGSYTVVGPSPYERKWFATVTVDASGRVVKVS